MKVGTGVGCFRRSLGVFSTIISPPFQVAWLPGAPLLAVATADGCLRVWDGRDGRLVVNHTGHAGLILDFAVIPEPAAPAPAPPAAAAAAAGAVSAPLEGVSAPSPAVAPGPDSVAVPAASDPSGAALTAKMASLAVPSAEEPSGVPVATGASVDAPPASRAPAPRGITIVTAGDDGVCRVYTVSA